MRIAATYDNGEIFQDFATTTQFKLYLVDEGEIFNDMVVDAAGDLLEFLAARKVDTLICGSIAADKKEALEQMSIMVYDNKSGSADEVTKSIL